MGKKIENTSILSNGSEWIIGKEDRQKKTVETR
jgi:hypothetical protein